MKLNDDERENLFARHGRIGHHYFTACAVCGYLKWRMTETNKPSDITVTDGHCADCPRCQEVRNRAPEIVEWVMAVLAYRDIRKERA